MADQDPSGIIGNLIDHVFTGGASDAVIAILVLVVGALGFSLWTVYKRLLHSEREKSKLSEDHIKELSAINKDYKEALERMHNEYQSTLKELNSSYQEFTKEVMDRQVASTADMTRALSSVQTTIAEMKTVVSIIGLRGPGHGTP